MQKKYQASVTYSIWTDEDREIGDTDQKGFERDVEPANLGDVLDLASTYNVEARSKGDYTRWWDAEAEQDYRSGEDTYYSLHVEYADGKPLSDADFKRINDFIAAGETSSSVYQEIADELSKTYAPKMKKMLRQICDVAREEGFDCGEVIDMSDETYRFAVLIKPKGADQEDGVDVTVDMAESQSYGDTEGGLNFSLDVVGYGGEIIGGLTPFNFSPQVWVSMDDPKAVAERWQLFDQGVDPYDVIYLVKEFYEKRGRSGNPSHAPSKEVRKIRNRVLK